MRTHTPVDAGLNPVIQRDMLANQLALGRRTSFNTRPRGSSGLPAHTRSGGAEGIRTPDLFNAIEALSQLSYSPIASL